MGEITKDTPYLPPEQEAIRARCFHPSGSFIEFRKEEIEQSIPSRFEQMVRKYPERIAVRAKSSSLTYEALNWAANRVARALLGQCGGEPEPVTLLVNHEAPTIAGMLGILKAGKICVPLDPLYPEKRGSYILGDLQGAVVLTDNKNLSSAIGLSQNARRLINLEEIDSDLSSENLGLAITSDSLAYIIYTSGSTGEPKGVAHNHRNILHNALRRTNGLRIGADDRITLFSALGTGGGISMSSCTLLNGAALYPIDIRAEGVTHLAAWLITEGITVYTSVSSVFRHFVSTLTGEEEFPKLRLITLTGEPAYRNDIEMYRKYFSSTCLLVNTLGATETGPLTQYVVDKEIEITGDTVPVGYALDDVEILLLNEAGEEVGFSEIGEIAVKSRYLSSGYWRRSDLTQTKFLPDPQRGDKEIYLTGDLGHAMPDGCLEYLGRKDFQVKVRGNRVEVAEVEEALHGLDGVRDAVVMAREDEPGDKRLVAYLVSAQDRNLNISEVRSALEQKLPAFMVPTRFVLLDALPLTPNGKVNLQALPAPGRTRPEVATPFIPPRTSIERELSAIWAEVLGLDRVGIHDRFFDLGGHSLAVARVVSRVFKTFLLELPIQSLFQTPTVAEMAVTITENQAKKVGQEEMARMLAELEALSDEEAHQLLADKGGESYGR